MCYVRSTAVAFSAKKDAKATYNHLNSSKTYIINSKYKVHKQ